MKLTLIQITKLREFFNKLLQNNSLSPSFIVKNLSVLNKISEELTEKINLLNSVYKKDDVNYIYITDSSYQIIKPFFDENGKSIIHSDENVLSQIKNDTDIFIPYFVNPELFEEYNIEYNNINNEVVEDLKIYKITEEEVIDAEKNNKITSDDLLILHQVGYYTFD